MHDKIVFLLNFCVADDSDEWVVFWFEVFN